MTLSIIIPVYNEIKTIKQILKKVEAVSLNGIKKEIIIIDDGSHDGTMKFLKSLKITAGYHILYHSKNLGKGSAILTGLSRVTGDYVIIQDADLENDPQDYNTLLNYSINNNALVVYGSRLLGKNRKGSVLFFLGGQFITFVTNILYKAKLTDAPTCYKLFKKELILSLNLKSKKFDFCPEVNAKILKKGIKIPEVPIHYYPRTAKQGKKLSWTDGLIAIYTLAKYKFID